MDVLNILPTKPNHKVVLQSIQDSIILYGSTTRTIAHQVQVIKKGDLFILDSKAPDGTRWIFHNFKRGTPSMYCAAKFIGEIPYRNIHKDPMLFNLIGPYSSSYEGKLDWQEELTKIVFDNLL